MRSWTAPRLRRISECFRGSSPEVVLAWGLEYFGPRICLATSFGPQSTVLMHLVSRLRPETTIFYLDTGLLFDETYDLRDELEQRLKLRFVRVATDLSVAEQTRQHGAKLWARQPDVCCHLRKMLPLRKFLADKSAWVTGIRRRHTPNRGTANLAEWDAGNGLVKLNPLIHWSDDKVWTYLDRHDLPTNPLHDQGYPSIGCRPCTVAVGKGADPRSGRWSGLDKTECGIHLNSDITIRPSDGR